jgi:hypothetical protein
MHAEYYAILDIVCENNIAFTCREGACPGFRACPAGLLIPADRQRR